MTEADIHHCLGIIEAAGLTPLQQRIVNILLSRAHPQTVPDIALRLWEEYPDDAGGDHDVRKHLMNIRRRLAGTDVVITTSWGRGYVLERRT